MLLSRREKKWNSAYIASLVLSVLLFYTNILTGSEYAIASILTLMILFAINVVKYNTFNKALKRTLIVIYYFLMIWMISNKIYFSFYGTYLNFYHIFSGSGAGIVATAAKGKLTSFAEIISLLINVLNLIAFNKSKFRFKKLRYSFLPLIVIYLLTTVIVKSYNYEVISFLAVKSWVNETGSNKTYKEITTDKKNPFEELRNKTHKDNPYTGIARDRNLIIVQCESFQDVLIGKKYTNGNKEWELTPNINKLITDNSLYFSDCFAQIGWGNTSDAECVVMNSVYPVPMESMYKRYENNYFYGLPKIMKEQGYSTNVFHGYLKEMWNRDKFYPTCGFDNYYHSEHYPTKDFIGFGIADKAFFDMTTDYMKEQEGKYFDFIISLSSHTPYNTNSSMSEIRLKASDRGTTYGNYLIAINYLDSAIGEFIQELKDKGLYDNSIIVFYGDHHGLHKSDADSAKFMSNFLGYPYGFDDMENIPLIVHIPGLGRSEEIKTTCGQMDIAPTILNLMGIENTALHFGEDILSLPEDSDRPIGGNTYMQAGSFINKDYVFIMSKDSIYENSTIIDRKTKGIASNLVSKDSIYDMSKWVDSQVALSNTMTENDLMKAILDNDTIVLNEINPQEYVFKINSDNDKYVYSSRLKEAYDAGYNLVAVKCFEKKITEDEVEFYVNNEQNVFNKMSLFDFLEEASKYENMYVIITGVTENIGKLYDKLSVEYPKLCSISIPVVYSFSDYYNLKRYGTNIPILSLDRLGCSKSELMSFISSNDVFACLTTVSDDNIKFNYEFSEVVSKAADIFTYADEVNNSSEEIYYKDKYIKGFFTTNK